MSSKRIIFNYSREKLELILSEYGFQPYNVRQIFKWLYKKFKMNPEKFSDLSKEKRVLLSEQFNFHPLKVEKRYKDNEDNTVKLLLRTQDDSFIETVVIQHEDHFTQCLSTQIGCPLGCRICMTAQMGFKRNLDTAEIVFQLLGSYLFEKRTIRNIVFMGMGEPLLNVENLIEALKIITDDCGYDSGKRRITVSTCGILPALKKLLDVFPDIGIALSLNAPLEKRSSIMPVEKSYPFEDVIRFYAENKDLRRPTIEYVLIRDLNDSADDAESILKLTSQIRCKINVIPYNETAELPYKSIDEEKLNDFVKILCKGDNAITVRRSKGRNIFAACGQLAGNKNVR